MYRHTDMTSIKPSARAVRSIIAAALVPALVATEPSIAQRVPIGQSSVVETVATLKPGEYVWAPRAAPAGPMLLIVIVTSQGA